jgi:hypothetical protein
MKRAGRANFGGEQGCHVLRSGRCQISFDPGPGRASHGRGKRGQRQRHFNRGLGLDQVRPTEFTVTVGGGVQFWRLGVSSSCR